MSPAMQIVTSSALWERQSACSTGQERLLPSLPQCGLLSKRQATCSPWQASSRASAVGLSLSWKQCRELLQLHPLRPPVEVRAVLPQQQPHHSKSGQGRAGSPSKCTCQRPAMSLVPSSGSRDQDSHVGHAISQGTRPASARSPTEKQARPCQDGTRQGTRCLQNGTGTNPKGLLTRRG